MGRAEETPGRRVRNLVRETSRAGLATLLADEASPAPYVSLVLVALDHDASPLLLLSDLADHTKNLHRDPRAALLFDGTGGWRDPLAGPRASLLGQIQAWDGERLKARFLARHPNAAVYAGFTDFHLYRMAVERAHLVAGFGEIHWLDAGAVLFDTADTGALYQRVIIMTHRDGLSELSVRSQYRRDVGHHKMLATRPESSERPPFRSLLGPVGGRQQALTMPSASPAACFLPDRSQKRSLWVIIITLWY